MFNFIEPMSKKGIYIILFVFLFSCDLINVQENLVDASDIVAIVNTKRLYRSDLKEILPKNLSQEDSVQLSKSYIKDWAIKQLLIDKAENNSSLENINEIESLVRDYKESLLINNYKEQLIKQQLDTLITENQINDYYQENKQNFKLNEELIQLRYLHFDTNILNKEEYITLFKSDNIEDLERLEKEQLSFKNFMFNDSIWTPIENVMLKLPFSKEILLKKTKFLQKQDSLGLYLVAIKDVLERNQIAPKSYITPTIKQMILHKRKIELIREIEKILLRDATKNNNFREF